MKCVYLQKLRKATLSGFDEKREKFNEIETIPWN